MADAITAARGKAFVQVLSCVLSRLVDANDRVRIETAGSGGSLTSPPRWRAGPDSVSDLAAPIAQAPEQSTGVVTKFHALRPPSISIRDYLER